MGISYFDCFRQPLGPFTLRTSKKTTAKIETHFGTLCGAFASLCILTVLVLLAFPRVEQILRN